MTGEGFDHRVGDGLRAAYERQAARCAAHLREAANAVERHGKIRYGASEYPDHTASAGAVVGDVQRLLAALPLDGLLTAAADADRYYRMPDGDS